MNGSPTAIGVLSQLGALLVDLHGQHETQSLLRPDVQRELLDAFSDAQARECAADAHEKWKGLEQREEELRGKQDDVRRKADYLQHVVEEIRAANPKVGEDDALAGEAQRLAHADELGRLARELDRALDTAGLARAAKLLAALQRLDPSAAAWQPLLDGAFANTDELARAAREYGGSIDADPDRLARLEQRRDVLFRLAQKYGPTLPDVLAARDAAARELELLDTADLDLRALAEQRDVAAADFTRACGALTAKRQAGAARMAQAVDQAAAGARDAGRALRGAACSAAGRLRSRRGGCHVRGAAEYGSDGRRWRGSRRIVAADAGAEGGPGGARRGAELRRGVDQDRW